MKGKRATQCSWDDIQVTLNRTTGPAGAEKDSFYQVYKLENPTRWFLITNKPEADLLNNTTKTVNNQPFSLHFKRREEENLNTRILWAPPKLELEAIEKIVKRNLWQKAKVSRPEDAKDRGRIDVTVPYTDPEKNTLLYKGTF